MMCQRLFLVQVRDGAVTYVAFFLVTCAAEMENRSRCHENGGLTPPRSPSVVPKSHA